MRKTHKKILGSIGLGLVVATTAVAATIPSPMASAVTSATDTIKITVLSVNPDLIPSTDKGSTITTPEYNFSVFYSSLLHISATLVNYDADGNIKYNEVIWDEDLEGAPGTKDFDFNLEDYGGYGDYVITFKGKGGEGIEVEQILSVAYVVDSRSLETDENTGEATTPVEAPEGATAIETYIYNPDGSLARIEVADVNTGVVSVYDASGSLLFTINSGYNYGALTITLEGLKHGDGYTGKIVFRNANGELVSGTILLSIKHNGNEPVVPDTGSFFQGLNISREDYLITGLLAFLVVGVVAFGIVVRNHRNHKSIKGNRR